MRLARIVTALALTLGLFAIPTAVALDGPPGSPATELPADPNGCYGEDVYGGWWPCNQPFPDFCLNGISGAYHFQPCDENMLTPGEWCDLYPTHPNCASLPKTGEEEDVLLYGATAAVVAGVALRAFGRKRRTLIG